VFKALILYFSLSIDHDLTVDGVRYPATLKNVRNRMRNGDLFNTGLALKESTQDLDYATRVAPKL